ncbi:MAG: LysR family transcriptional regulator [Paenalcaligenes sp.]
MWQLRQLEAFHAVMTTGSMTRAAQGLHVTQPAVSKLISMLEEACGFKLFVRNGNQLSATEEARLLHAEVSRALIGTQDIQRKAQEIKDKRVGTLRLAAFPALATRTLPTIVSGFCQNRPGIRVLLTGRSSMFMVDWLTAHRVDLAISVLKVDESAFHNKRLLRMEALCIMPKGHPLEKFDVITPSLISQYDFIALSNEDKSQLLVDQFFAAEDVSPKIRINTQLSESACQLVADGMGIALVDPLSTLGFRSENIVTRPISPRFYFDIWLLTSTARPASMITQEFMAFFSTELIKLLEKNNFSFQLAE